MGIGLMTCHFVGRFSDLVVPAAVVQLLGLGCGVGGADATVFHAVLGAIMALRMFLSTTVSTPESGLVDGTA